MQRPKRDLLVLLKQELMTPQAMEQQVDQLHELLYKVESVENLILAHEIININNYKVSSKSFHLRNLFRQREIKPFVFLNCKN
jgi:hypothetical protein